MKALLRTSLILMLLVSGFTQAQTEKVGYVNVDYVLALMPETTDMQNQIVALQKQFSTEIEGKYKTLEANINRYKEQVATMSDAIKQATETDLVNERNRVQKLEQDRTTEIQNKSAALADPIYTKLSNMIKAVAEKNGYNKVLNENINGVAVVLYSKGQEDITNLVLKEMGITPPAGN